MSTDPKIADALEYLKTGGLAKLVEEIRALVLDGKATAKIETDVAVATALCVLAGKALAHDDLVAALDQIHMLVSYIKVHGVGEQPPPREDGLPQIKRASVEELGFVLDKISELSRAALAKAGAL